MIEVFRVEDYFNFAAFAHRFEPVATALLILFFVICMGIFALNAFEGVNLESKVLNLILAALFISFWPDILQGMKDLVDTFDAFLIQDIFGLNWNQGLGQKMSDQILQGLNFGDHGLDPVLGMINDILLISLRAAGLIIEWLFMIYFFFYAVLGPLVIARGVMSEELQAFVELVRETVILLLWQSTYVIIVGLINPRIGSGDVLVGTWSDLFGMATVKAVGLTVLIFMIPSITRKFVGHISGSIFPKGFRWGGAALGLSAAHWMFSRALLPARAVEGGTLLEGATETALKFEEFLERTHHHNKAHRAEHAAHKAHGEAHHHEAEKEALAHEAEHELHHHLDAHHHGEKIEAEHVQTTIEHVEETEGEESAHGLGLESSPVSSLKIPFIMTGHKKTEKKEIHHKPRPQTALQEYLQSQEEEEELEAEEKKQEADEKKEAENEKVTEIENKKEAEQKEILYTRGPKGSDKYKDMEKLGIQHDDFTHESLEVVRAYHHKIEEFNHQFGWLYNYEGQFVGPEGSRPHSWQSQMHEPKHRGDIE